MEPAAKWREHQHIAMIGPTGEGPQWSPPSNGGSTRLRQRGDDERLRAAMEPAGQRREHRC